MPCTNTNGHKSIGGWPTKSKGCAKHVEFQHRKHTEYDDMNKGMVNQNGKHSWYLMMQSMSKLEREEKTIMLKALTPQKLMIACVRCMMFGDVLILFLLRISDHN